MMTPKISPGSECGGIKLFRVHQQRLRPRPGPGHTHVTSTCFAFCDHPLCVCPEIGGMFLQPFPSLSGRHIWKPPYANVQVHTVNLHKWSHKWWTTSHGTTVAVAVYTTFLQSWQLWAGGKCKREFLLQVMSAEDKTCYSYLPSKKDHFTTHILFHLLTHSPMRPISTGDKR